MIWQRYFLREICKVFFLFLFGFFFLYAAIDYSVHMQDFLKDKKLQLLDLALYYGFQFIKRATLIVPLALLIATIKVMTSFAAHKEWMALQVAGVSFKRLMRPFLLVSVLCALFNGLSAEFLVPKSLGFLDKFYYEHLKHSKPENKSHAVQSITLLDNSKLIYQTRDPKTGIFFDVIWLRSIDEIWKMRSLEVGSSGATGRYIDKIVRTKPGVFEKRESFLEKTFPEIAWEKSYVRKGYVPYENRSLSTLFRMSFAEKATSYAKMELLSQFYYKCAMPALSILVVLAIAPFCIRHARGAPVFFLYASGLFAFIGFFTLMDAALILGENRIAHPAVAILLPLTLCSAPFIWKFARKA